VVCVGVVASSVNKRVSSTWVAERENEMCPTASVRILITYKVYIG
jgi:hypothetical protein